MTQLNNTTPTTSRFYAPCLMILQQNAPAQMSVTAIIEAIRLANPEIDFRACNGGGRALLIRMANHEDSPIHMVENSQPPLFFVEKNEPITANVDTQSSCLPTQKRCNSIFYAPACEILKANAPAQMSANEMMKAIIKQLKMVSLSPVRIFFPRPNRKPNAPHHPRLS